MAFDRRDISDQPFHVELNEQIIICKCLNVTRCFI